MTIPALLSRLKTCDPACYQEIMTYQQNGWTHPRNQALDYLQGVCQRACVTRRWDWQIRTFYADPLYYIAYVIGDGRDYEGQGDSPASAILEAYVKACERQT